jgi:formate hydrogenlyase subunit 4
LTGALFFAGDNFLFIIFTLTLANVFLIVGAYSSNSPYAQIGAERELVQVISYEPMILITAIGFYLYTGSFDIRDIITYARTPFVLLIGIFFGYVYILMIRFRKSPFDLSMSHHKHHELVKGITTEMSGKSLALIEIAHWYEKVFLLSVIPLFFMNGANSGFIIGAIFSIVVYFFEVLTDNSFARMKWQFTLKSSWAITVVAGFTNLSVLYLWIIFGYY